jgi:toxin ParE1/3/4
MALHIELRPAARSDVGEALAYYAGISAVVAEGFNREFLEALSLLAESPHVGSRRYAHFTRAGDMRFWRLDRYPFLLFYRVEGSMLIVGRLIHERRRITRNLLRVK